LDSPGDFLLLPFLHGGYPTRGARPGGWEWEDSPTH
jgi:hypothetical protein